MTIELYECKPLNSRITLKQCEYNRTRGGCYSCAKCSGAVKIITSQAAPAPAALPDNAVLLYFEEPADRAVLEQLRAVSTDLPTDILALLHVAIETLNED